MCAALAAKLWPQKLCRRACRKPGPQEAVLFRRYRICKVAAMATRDSQSPNYSNDDRNVVPSKRSSVSTLVKVSRLARDTWARLDPPQRAYTAVAAAALALLLPQLLALAVIPLERLVVGGLLAVEEVLALALLQGAKLALLAGMGVLLAWGAYVFLVGREEESG